MDASPTPGFSGVIVLTETPPPLPEVTTKGISTDDGVLTALIGGIVSAVLLLLICIIAVLLWCLSRHKGSYVTNEMDDEDYIEDDDDDDEESVGSDTALQSREPLKIKEEE